MRVQFHSFGHAKKKKGVWQLNAEGALDLDPLNIKVPLQFCSNKHDNRSNSDNNNDNDTYNDNNNDNDKDNEIMSMSRIKITIKRFPAHDELGSCGTSLASPELSVLRISTRSTNSTVLTILNPQP